MYYIDYYNDYLREIERKSDVITEIDDAIRNWKHKHTIYWDKGDGIAMSFEYLPDQNLYEVSYFLTEFGLKVKPANKELCPRTGKFVNANCDNCEKCKVERQYYTREELSKFFDKNCLKGNWEVEKEVI